MKKEEWLYIYELAKKFSFPIYGEDYEDAVEENFIYCIEKINVERKHPGRRKKIDAELIRQKIANRIRTRKAKYRRERELCINLL